MSKITTAKLKKMKLDKTPIAMITAYDYPSAKLAEQAGADILLVGDSLGNVVLGYDSTIPVTVEDMIYHSRVVARAVERCFIVTDMPFLTYHGSSDAALQQVARIMQEGHAHSVKMEGGAEIAANVQAITRAGVPVMGHLGLTPQSVHQIGGFKVQGRELQQAQKLIEDAKALEEAGVYAIVLELVTEELAKRVSESVSVPTIGIGSGRYCDGQVLVYHDVIQYAPDYRPKKFVKTYANVEKMIREGIAEYVREVKEGKFPDESHVFPMNAELIPHLYGGGK
ncbi:3-methyl-2-oxobutanoate hydroxymethyltransferase [Paenibacillus swuensis]|uniref:3-methyl-2-oxobutanoate hydroxymethyltransferase n=1 Tax=Paenibacillus swuensis TaxID=1178515 RepID=A0A172TLJ5_9BACL|nr:3-methyl-2-oxobutanoate hydroxymethyltransferase [Paenibacillus swuensis]ANE47939.1 3-methyl-2-oxobutanoate hydroxymethyltransferase [Paenibacillus swuensis]